MEAINDIRDKKAFIGITFSKYKKSEAKKQLLSTLLDGKIEGACYWSAEYICAGHFLDLWDIILLFTGKNIHLGNPKLSIYLNIRFNDFKNIVKNGYIDNEIKMRNNNDIRGLFAEIITILCLSNKKHDVSQIKVNKDAFDISFLSDKLQADSTNYADIIYNNPSYDNEDPKNIYIALNEFIFNLINVRKLRESCYWLEWLLEFETIYKKKKKIPIICARRSFTNIDVTYQMDFIWIIWEILIIRAKDMDAMVHGKEREQIIRALLGLFTIKYKPTCKKKRRFILYNAISILTERYNPNIPVYNDEKRIKIIKKKRNLIYGEIKKNETPPKDAYLFNNSICAGPNNIDNTIKKLNILNNLI
jgi:hypothetical protein